MKDDLADELRGFAIACGAKEAGDGASRVQVLTSAIENARTEANIRAVLADTLASALAEAVSIIKTNRSLAIINTLSPPVHDFERQKRTEVAEKIEAMESAFLAKHKGETDDR